MHRTARPLQCCHARVISNWIRRHISTDAQVIKSGDALHVRVTEETSGVPTLSQQRKINRQKKQQKVWVAAEDSPADMTSPHLQHPVARNMRRHIIYHAGPTNSGKTRSALDSLKKATNGIYAAPLRLLAWEVYEKLNSEGTPCNLLTGQESEQGYGQHLSCTVEMVDTSITYECAVLDEIQMIADPDRGWAWTRALLGLPAREIHVCGDESAELLVRALAKQCGDTFDIQTYTRLLPLHMGPPLSSMKWQARPGDCFVGFGRKDLYGIRHDLESARGDLEISIVYGALPPETRRNQAAKFNGPAIEGKHKVLVASDAIGMGLNLNIGRIVFTSLEKYDGTQMRLLNRREIKQIAGRAGRFGKGHEMGEVVCMDEADTKYVKENLHAPLQPLKRAGLAPTSEQLTAFHNLAEQGEEDEERPRYTGFAGTIERFMKAAVVSNLYSMCKNEQILEIAVLLERVPELTLQERYIYCQAPVQTREPVCMSHLLKLAKAHARGRVGDELIPEVHRTLRFESDMLQLEICHKMLDVFQWLARRFPKVYRLEETEETVMTRQAEVCEFLESGLRRSALSWKRRVRK